MLFVKGLEPRELQAVRGRARGRPRTFEFFGRELPCEPAFLLPLAVRVSPLPITISSQARLAAGA